LDLGTYLSLPALALIASGAMLGAILRWWLGLALNQHFTVLHQLPLGTLAANFLGGMIIGMVLGLMQLTDSFSSEWRLFLMTGFLGSLTTFSTFSAEVITLIQTGRLLAGVLWIGVHVIGTLTLTWLGMACVMWLFATSSSS
jgi:CrcB protein